MRTWLAFADLKTGDRFRFVYGAPHAPHLAQRPTSAKAYTKSGNGWFSDETGRKFRTGRLTAVALEPTA